jgi:BNR repeat-like domain
MLTRQLITFANTSCSMVAFLLACIISVSHAQQMISNNYTSAIGLKRLPVDRSMIYEPGREWMYSHHPYITFFNNRFIAAWSNGLKDEDNPGQRVAFSISTDFVNWSAPKTLASPAAYKSDTLNVLTAVGFHQFNDTLVAYFGEYSPHKTNTKLWAKTSTDGENWSEAINLNIPVNANLGPQKIASGRLIISGNFTFPYTDDYRGLRDWKMSSFYPDTAYKEDNPSTFYTPAAKRNLPPLCEASFFQTDDGMIHSLLRVTGGGWKGHLWMTESKDNGVNWSLPVEAPFSDNDSKFHFGRLPDRRFYYVGIPDTLNHYGRSPLVLSISTDGKSFNQHYIIADENYTLKKEGLWKGGQYGYPYSFIHKDYMYVIISRQKEAVEVIRFKLNQL